MAKKKGVSTAKRKELDAAYRAKNGDKMREYSKEWSRDNPEKRKKITKKANKNRYRTEAYRKRNREYKYLRYHAEPNFRRTCIDAVTRYKRKQSDDREKPSAHAGSLT